MRTRWRFVIISTLLCALPIQAQKAMHKHAVKKPIADSAWSELQSSMAKMHAAMASVDPSGNSDADFVRLMIPHHQAAIDMAKTQLLYGRDPNLGSPIRITTARSTALPNSSQPVIRTRNRRTTRRGNNDPEFCPLRSRR
jgi:hypothetical protein